MDAFVSDCLEGENLTCRSGVYLQTEPDTVSAEVMISCPAFRPAYGPACTDPGALHRDCEIIGLEVIKSRGKL
jgi:hypothetical protein